MHLENKQGIMYLYAKVVVHCAATLQILYFSLPIQNSRLMCDYKLCKINFKCSKLSDDCTRHKDKIFHTFKMYSNKLAKFAKTLTVLSRW